MTEGERAARRSGRAAPSHGTHARLRVFARWPAREPLLRAADRVDGDARHLLAPRARDLLGRFAESPTTSSGFPIRSACSGRVASLRSILRNGSGSSPSVAAARSLRTRQRFGFGSFRVSLRWTFAASSTPPSCARCLRAKSSFAGGTWSVCSVSCWPVKPPSDSMTGCSRPASRTTSSARSASRAGSRRRRRSLRPSRCA